MVSETANLGEGAGPEVLLGPGGARLFSFELGRATPVGIGIRASSDIVSSVLYDARGAIKAQGVVQMPTLLPGRYYLAIEMPTGSAPVLVQPVVFGLTTPDTRPPYETLRRYVEGHDDVPLIYSPQQAEPTPPPVPADEADSPHVAEEEGEAPPPPEDEGQVMDEEQQ
jgi:hypothetical protein